MSSSVTLQQTISTLLVLMVTSAEGGAWCPAECSCAPSPPPCPLGVSWATDRCGCCKVCARQFNEDCSPDQPCDHIKGLRCHLGAGGDPERGLCRAEAQGSPCEFGGRVYQHGEDFRPSCQHQCSCMDGVVGCMPLCPHRAPPPGRRRCPRPRPARPEAGGGCCEEWACDDEDEDGDNHIGEGPVELTPASPPDGPPLRNHISAVLPARPGGTTFREMLSFPVSEVLLRPSCFPQTTSWTECSTTCGMGVSSRVTNDNPDCRLVRETRLCQVRQCEPQLPAAGKRGRKCQRTARPREPVSIAFAGCATARRYRPRTCGTCSDGRCCAPSLSRTVRLHFRCPDGEGFHRDVMWIQRCSCGAGDGAACRALGGGPGPGVSLHNDIHTFRH